VLGGASTAAATEAFAPPSPELIQGPLLHLREALIRAERLVEARACERQRVTEEELEALEAEKRAAMMDDRLEDAIVCRDRIRTLQQTLASEETVRGWRSTSSPQGHESTRAVAARLADARGAPAAAAVLGSLGLEEEDPSLVDLASVDIENALLAQLRLWWHARVAGAAAAGGRLHAHVGRHWPSVAQACADHASVLASTATHAAEAEADVRDAFFGSEKLRATVRGVAAMYSVLARVRAATVLASTAASEAEALQGKLAAAGEAWEELRSVLERAGHKDLLEEPPTPDALVDALIATSAERLEGAEPPCPAALAQVPCCGVCALPLLDTAVPQSRFAGGSYHVLCVNLFANLVDVRRVPRTEM